MQSPRAVNTSVYDSKFNMLKFKFERFADNVAKRLDDIAFEINARKENKLHSIITLEGVINELKEEKAELHRKNEELRESNISMCHTISQLSQANKQLEDGKLSLITTVKIIQNDFNQQRIEVKARGNANEEPISSINVVDDENVRQKPKLKHQSKSPPTSLEDADRPRTNNVFQVSPG